MTNAPTQKLGTIGLSLLGVWMILDAVADLIFYVPLLVTTTTDYVGWGQLASPVVHVMLGVALVSQRDSLSATLFPGDSDVELDAVPPMHDFVVALLGVWLAVTSFARAVQVEFGLVHRFSIESKSLFVGDLPTYMMTAEAWSQRIPHLVMLICGLGLVLGARGLTRAWFSARGVERDA